MTISDGLHRTNTAGTFQTHGRFDTDAEETVIGSHGGGLQVFLECLPSHGGGLHCELLDLSAMRTSNLMAPLRLKLRPCSTLTLLKS